MAFKICAIGCGSMASHVHGPSYREYAARHGGTLLAACCDLDEGKAVNFREAYGFERHYTDIEAMLNAERPDAVCIVVPEHLTASVSIKVMAHGCPVLMEKPPGLNREETTSMIEMADRFDVPTQVAFNRRYMPLVRRLKEMLDALSAPSGMQMIRYDFCRVGRTDADFAATAIHGIDAVKHLAGSDYAHIQFRYQALPGYAPEVVNVEMICTFESGARAYLSFCPVSGVLLERATVHARDESFFLDLAVENAVDYPGRLVQYRAGRKVLEQPGEATADAAQVFVTGGFYDENAAFFQDIRAGKRPVGDLRSALQAVEIADCMRKRQAEYSKLS